MACSHFENCPLFSYFSKHPALLLWRTNYCDADYKQCARFKNSSKSLPNPVTLLPNGKLVDASALVLINAVRKKRIWLVKNLLTHVNVDINYQNFEGVTALMMAVQQNDITILRMLLRSGADQYLLDNYGQTAYDIAVKARINDAIQMLKPIRGAGTNSPQSSSV